MKKLFSLILIVAILAILVPVAFSTPTQAQGGLTVETVVTGLQYNWEAVMPGRVDTAIVKRWKSSYYGITVCTRTAPNTWPCQALATNGSSEEDTMAVIKGNPGVVYKTNSGQLGIIRNGGSWTAQVVGVTLGSKPSGAIDTSGRLVVVYARDYRVYLWVEGQGETEIPLTNPASQNNYVQNPKLAFGPKGDAYIAGYRHYNLSSYPVIWRHPSGSTWNQDWSSVWYRSGGQAAVEMAIDASQRMVVAHTNGYDIFDISPFALHLSWSRGGASALIAYRPITLCPGGQSVQVYGTFHRRNLYEVTGGSDVALSGTPLSVLWEWGLMATGSGTTLSWYQINNPITPTPTATPTRMPTGTPTPTATSNPGDPTATPTATPTEDPPAYDNIVYLPLIIR